MGKRKGPHPERQLSALAVSNTKKPGRYADGNGLYLVVDKSGSKKWVLRVVVHGKRRDMGLGSVSTTSLADARKDAERFRAVARKGGDPIAVRAQEQMVVPTFKQAAKAVHDSLKPTWKNPKHGDQWINTLTTYAFPKLGSRRIDHIGAGDVHAVLAPIWLEKPETARRVRQRIHVVFDWARAQGIRPDNPVDGVTRGLPRQPKRQKHHAALPYSKVPAFLRKVRDSGSGLGTKLALEFTILTALRTTEVRQATWKEIDLEHAVWTVPATRMKAPRDHRVPLSSPALAVLKQTRKLSNGEPGTYVFPGEKRGKPLSSATMLALLRRMGMKETVHGFRSSFIDWAAENTNFPERVRRACLAHVEENKTEAAYERTDFFEKRRKLMDGWARHVTSTKGEVIPLRA